MATLQSLLPAEFGIVTQEGFLKRTLETAIAPTFAFKDVSEKESIPAKIGLPYHFSVPGLRGPKLTPNNVSNPADPNAGMTASNVGFERFSMTANRYDDLAVVDMITRPMPVADQFVLNAKQLAQGAGSTRELLARNALLHDYTGGNTRVKTTANATTIAVDDVRGFSVEDTPVVYVNGVAKTLTGVTPDETNASTLVFTDGTGMFGRSGTLTFSAAVNATAGQSVVAERAPKILRAGAKKTTALLADGDKLTGKMILAAKNELAKNGVPRINGAYNCYVSGDQLLGLYEDAMFQNFFRGGYDSEVWKNGEITKMLGVRLIETQSNPVQELEGVGAVHRAIVVGAGALREGVYTGHAYADRPHDNSPVHIELVEDVAFMTMAPIDPAAQFVRQSYVYIGGFAARTDKLITPAVIPSATKANYKRAVVLESL